MLTLLPVSSFNMVSYQSYYGGIICKFHYGVTGVDEGTIVEDSVMEWAEDSSLWCAFVQDEGG